MGTSDPLAVLPLELVACIFADCNPPIQQCTVIEDDSSHAPALFGAFDSLDITKPPWTFSYVSSRWRDVSLSLPSLWTSVGIVTNVRGSIMNYDAAGDMDRTHRQKRLAETQLQRTGSDLPLVVSYISFYDWVLRDEIYFLKPLLMLLTSYAPRWSILHFLADTIQYGWLETISPSLDLSSLHTIGSFSSRNFFGGVKPHTFSQAANLTRVTGDSMVLFTMPFPWQSVKYLCDTSEGILRYAALGLARDSFLRLVEKTPLLEECRVKAIFDQITSKTPPQIAALQATLPFLTRLQLYGVCAGRSVTDILRHLTLPALCDLVLEGRFLAHDLVPFMERSGCSLKSLSLWLAEEFWSDDSTASDECVPVLTATGTSLERLHLRIWPSLELWDFDYLGSPTILPKLKELKMESDEDDPLPSEFIEVLSRDGLTVITELDYLPELDT